MLTLYVKDHCRFSKRALAGMRGVTEPYEIKNKSLNPAFEDELRALQAGSGEVPFLVDSARSVTVDESDDIVAYVRQHYGASASGSTEGDATGACTVE